MANLPKQQASLWHAYRRVLATGRKHLPEVDVAAAVGWKSTEILRRCYQQPDAETMLAVVLGGAELQEKEACAPFLHTNLAHPTFWTAGRRS